MPGSIPGTNVTDPGKFSMLTDSQKNAPAAPTAPAQAGPSGAQPPQQSGQTTQPTVLSSANVSENTIPDNNAKLAQISSTRPSPGSDAFGNPIADTGIQTARDNNGTYTGIDGQEYYSYDNSPAGGSSGTATIPGTQTPTTGDPATDSIIKQMSDMKTSMDASSAATISNIQSQYQDLINQQQQANAGQEASLNSLLIRGGSMQTASGTSAMSAQISFGLSKISDLQQKENAAIAAAQQAQESNDFQQLDKQLAIFDQIRQSKQAEMQKQTDLIAQNKVQATKDNAVVGLIDQGMTDPNAIFNELQKQGYDTISLKDVTDTVNSLNTVKTNPLTSTAMTWASDFLKNGGDQATANKAIAMAATDPTGALAMLSGGLSDPYKAASDKLALEQKQADLAKTQAETANAKKATADSKILSVNDAMSLGVPYGTTQAQAFGKGVMSSADIKPGTDLYKVAQDLAYGKLTMQQFRTIYSYSRNLPQKMGLYAKAAELNPNFDPSAFELGYSFAANPKVRQQVTSLDNVMNVMPNVIAASDAAIRTSTGLNAVVIKGGVMLGSTSYANMKLARIAFADELSGGLGYGSATDMSRAMGFDLTDPNLSAQQFKDGMTQIVQPFIESKRSTLVNAMGQYGNVVNNQSSGAAGSGAGGVKLKDPNTGEVRSFKQMSPNDFKDAMSQGYTVVQ